MRAKFSTRSDELERLDTGDYTAAEYKRWHQEMRYIHRVFGEFRAIKATLIPEITGRDHVSILDVGAGSGELLRWLKRTLAGKDIFAVGAEIEAESAKAIQRGGSVAILCDGSKLPFGNGVFDHSICSLFLHHLNNEDGARVLSEMARVSAGRIFAVDLNRDAIAYYTYRFLGSIFLQKFTVEDGALSILRSRTMEELRELAGLAGLVNVRIDRSRVNRLVLSGTSPR